MAKKKLTQELTPAQRARFPEFVSRWTDIGLCTAAADRPRAEAAIRAMYAAAKLSPPHVVWCGSPLSQGLTRAIVRTLPASVWASVGASVWDSVWDSVRDSVGASVRDSVRASVRDSVRASVWDSVGASVNESAYGAHDAGWLSFYSFFRDVLGLADQTAPLCGLLELAHSAGWALPHEKLCWVSERHNVLRRNELGRLHATDGPAVSYPDGWQIFAVNGTRIPGEWITDPKTLTPEAALGQSNVELRRAAVELLGWHKVLSNLPHRVIDADVNPQIGTLLSVDLPDAPNSRFIRVECGTRRTFALPVPPEMTTAREANAWTYGLSKEELELEART